MRARMEAGTERHERPQMEPKKSSPQSQSQPQKTEAKKFPSRAAVDTAAAGADSSLSGLFYPPSHGPKNKDQDLYAILCKGQNGSAQPGIADGKSQWTPPKSRSAYTKDNKHQYDSVDTSCFGSSVHYGGRDYFYGNSTPKLDEEANDVDKKDPAADSHGDWWQGSFYY